jgi:dephospho-CoA kinase
MYKKLDIEIFGFIGNMGSGKNYVAEKLFLPNLKSKPSLVIAFADHFKLSAVCFQKLEYNKVFGEKDDSTRKRLQELGTEFGRDKYGDNIWCDMLYNTMKMYSERGIERFIITDVRFENEVKFIKDLDGIIIKIDAPDRTLLRLQKESSNDEEKIKELSNHRSETFIKKFIDYDYYINNSINIYSITQVKSIIEKIYA